MNLVAYPFEFISFRLKKTRNTLRLIIQKIDILAIETFHLRTIIFLGMCYTREYTIVCFLEELIQTSQNYKILKTG